MKLIYIIIICIISFSCSKDDVLQLKQEGYISFTGSVTGDKYASSAKVPTCSDLLPTGLKYTLRSIEGYNYTATSDITINNNIVTALEPLAFPVGVYQLIEVWLLADDGIVTHSVPYADEYYSQFVNTSLPITIEILPNSITNSSLQVVCYEDNILLPENEIDPEIEIIEFENLYYYISETTCVAYLTIQLNEHEPVPILNITPGLHTVQILKTTDYYRVNSYSSFDVLLQSFDGTDYDPNTIIEFTLPCLSAN